MKRILSVFIAVLMALSVCAYAEDAGLTVQGTGVVKVTADRAQVFLGVRETAADVLEAQSAANEKIDMICLALTEAGLSALEISTQSLYIYANYDYVNDSNEIVSYTAVNTLAINVTDMDRVGEFIDIAFAAGANTLDSVGFTAENTEAAQREALKLAVQNALDKAGAIADAAGMTLGSIVEINEVIDYYGMPVAAKTSNFRAEGAADAATSVQAASLEVSAAVTVEFELN